MELTLEAEGRHRHCATVARARSRSTYRRDV